ncbi:efflux RND transporter periplasmic adaptor subunit [Phaeobacter inhibens]|uniref:efflux RND transporter periplasmic adaptor subunit n=1 Tax=Phaeobacter inhibens TaxID=221822 RepID=UPI000160DC07|nr:efflux RND transporter periplasmic adaptor subunit [Phaeobacter inhibens]AFO88251.1 putative secretion protein [Phaeobacter inhibens 2.10]AXT43007.1 efflux RND transporter periplasmic adaptor subunit [Phaeobacter inhibens]
MQLSLRAIAGIAALMLVGVPALAADVLKPVKLMVTQSGAMPIHREFYGQVAAKETVDLAFQVGGQVVKFPVTEGAFVPKGALVAELDLEPFELKLGQAQLQKEQADRTVTRLEKLTGTVSQVSIDDAETQAGLSRIALRDADYALEHATLSAPFDALVSSREVALFSTVSAGAPVVRLHDMSELHIEVDVPEVLFQQGEDNDALTITATFPGSDTAYPLEILEFDAEASSVGQTYRVTFRLDPPKDRQIFPGASTTVRVTVDTGASAIVVPPTAIVPAANGETGVMLFSPKGGDEGTVTWTKVETAATDGGRIEITSGLQGGEEIVLTGGGALADGEAVRRFTGFTN